LAGHIVVNRIGKIRRMELRRHVTGVDTRAVV
jgi:hypothetical protein